MRLFFKGKGFKIILGIVLVLMLLSGASYVIGKSISPQSGILGAVITPFQKLSSAISSGINEFFTSIGRADSLEEENNALREQIRSLRSQVVELDEYRSENEFYAGFLELKEQHSDFKFEAASVIATDSVSVGGSFIVDSGSLSGVALHDPVITADALAGYVSEVQPTYSVVVSILDPSISVGAIDSRTRESGVVSGDATLLESRLCRMSYLSRTSAMTSGDYVITSGTGGIFPEGLVVGVVTDIDKEAGGVSLFASVKPTVDFENMSQVMIITEFEGQGGLED